MRKAYAKKFLFSLNLSTDLNHVMREAATDNVNVRVKPCRNHSVSRGKALVRAAPY